MARREPGRRNPLTYMSTEVFQNLMRQLMFCLPGRILAFDPDTQLAQVEAGIKRFVGDEAVTIPVIENVPVCFPGDNQFYFWHQITPGETEGVIHFSQRALDTWIEQGGPVAPHERRMLSEEDAFFVPGTRSKPGAIPDFKNDGAGISDYAQANYVHLRSDGTIEMLAEADITADAGGSIQATAGADITADAEGSIAATAGGDITAEATGNADVTAAAITLNGPTTINGSLTVNGGISGQGGEGANIEGDVVSEGVSLVNHTHAQGSDSNGDSEVDTNAPTPTE